MLEIFDNLTPFFEDTTVEISVREYARVQNISPPTASKILKNFENESILISEKKGIYVYYRVNKNFVFEGLAKLFWQVRLHNATEYLHKDASYRKIILFGSLAKGENIKNSDIDLYIDTNRKEFDTSKLEKEFKRKVQLHFIEETKNIYLKNNIDEGLWIR